MDIFINMDFLYYKMSVLEEEIKTFERSKPKLLKTDKDKYVLIKGKKVIGTFYDRRDAIVEGYKKFPKEAFLVRKIQEFEETHNLVNVGVQIQCHS